MGFNIGSPYLKLTREGVSNKQSKTGAKSKHGSALAIAQEAMSERFSADPDLDRGKSKYNVVDSFIESGKGQDLYDYWVEQADSYRVKRSDGKEQKLRQDAPIGLALILKPPMELMDTFTPAGQKEFLNDLSSVGDEILAEYGIITDATVWHYDEGNPHLHKLGHDPDYHIGRNIGLKFNKALNHELPKRMRERGWDMIDDNAAIYDSDEAKRREGEAVKKLKAENPDCTDDDVKRCKKDSRKAYREELKPIRKARKAGRSSIAYKTDKTLEAVRIQKDVYLKELDEREVKVSLRESNVMTKESVLKTQEKEYANRLSSLKDREQRVVVNEQYVAKRYQELADQESDIEARERKLEANKKAYFDDLARFRESADKSHEELIKRLESANKAVSEANKAKQAYEDMLKYLQDEVPRVKTAIERDDRYKRRVAGLPTIPQTTNLNRQLDRF